MPSRAVNISTGTAPSLGLRPADGRSEHEHHRDQIAPEADRNFPDRFEDALEAGAVIDRLFWSRDVFRKRFDQLAHPGRSADDLDRSAALAPFDLTRQLSSNRTQGVPNMIALVKEHAARIAAN